MPPSLCLTVKESILFGMFLWFSFMVLNKVSASRRTIKTNWRTEHPHAQIGVRPWLSISWTDGSLYGNSEPCKKPGIGSYRAFTRTTDCAITAFRQSLGLEPRTTDLAGRSNSTLSPRLLTGPTLADGHCVLH